MTNTKVSSPCVLFFAGAGGVGKTTIARAVANNLDRSLLVPSTTRKTFARLGFKSEQEVFELKEDELRQVQAEVMGDFREAVEQALDELRVGRYRVLVFDRTMFDYAAYQISVLPHLNLSQITRRLRSAVNLHKSVENRFPTRYYYCPCPSPWASDETEDSENEVPRFAPMAKTYAWDAVLTRLLTRELVYSENAETKTYTITASSIGGREAEVMSDIERCMQLVQEEQ